MNTTNLLAWKDNFQDKHFYQISTDEVHAPYNPQSTYSASKAAFDHLVQAYGNIYGLPSPIQ